MLRRQASKLHKFLDILPPNLHQHQQQSNRLQKAHPVKEFFNAPYILSSLPKFTMLLAWLMAYLLIGTAKVIIRGEMLRTLKAADEEKATGFMGSVNICRDNKGVIESLHRCHFWWLLSSLEPSMHSGSKKKLSFDRYCKRFWEKVEETWSCLSSALSSTT